MKLSRADIFYPRLRHRTGKFLWGRSASPLRGRCSLCADYLYQQLDRVKAAFKALGGQRGDGLMLSLKAR